MEDFEKALEENPPQFGMDDKGLEQRLSGGFYDYGASFSTLYRTSLDTIAHVRDSSST